MAEPRPEQIAGGDQDEARGDLGDGGATYWYTPDRVIRSHAVTDRLLDGSLQTLYVVTPGPEGREPADQWRAEAASCAASPS